ncbi:hypothetical protein GQ600_13006 [Phytophthora cactorum]|nr:hypothetical protein GQ600_13006 [Phytophthora cactorum]
MFRSITVSSSAKSTAAPALVLSSDSSLFLGSVQLTLGLFAIDDIQDTVELLLHEVQQVGCWCLHCSAELVLVVALRRLIHFLVYRARVGCCASQVTQGLVQLLVTFSQLTHPRVADGVLLFEGTQSFFAPNVLGDDLFHVIRAGSLNDLLQLGLHAHQLPISV